MNLASETGCCLVCVLHQNKAPDDKTLRGSLGTELGNKCFEEFECKKDDNRVFYCQQVSTRKYDISTPLTFTVDSKGMPHLFTAQEKGETITPEGASSGGTMNKEYMVNGKVNYRKVFDTLLPEGTSLRACVLKRKFMELTGIQDCSWYGYMRNMALNEGYLKRIAYTPQWVEYARVGGDSPPASPLPI